jgi:vacuolar protein sorting-associated protein 29
MYQSPALPPSLVLQHGPLRIGLLHGHQLVPLGDTDALSAVARKMDVDVLISGGTHRFVHFTLLFKSLAVEKLNAHS